MFARVGRVIRRIRASFERDALDREFGEELESHIAMLTDEHIRRGLPAAEARRVALIEVGARTSLADQHRAARGLPLVDAVCQDMRFGLRQLLAHRGFALTAISVLALGLGAHVAILGFVDAALIRPLPYAEPSRLVSAFSTRPDRDRGRAKMLVSYLNLVEWRTRSRAFKSIDAFDVRPGFVLRTPQGPEPVSGLRVTSGFFRTLGVRPALGRDFHADEEGQAARPTVMLAYATWQARYGGRPDVLGQVVTIQGQPHAVIGVLPQGFYFPLAEHAEFWATIRGSQPCWELRSCRSLQAIARLADGVSMEAARSGLGDLLQQLRAESGEKNPETAAVSLLADEVLGDVRPILLALFGGVALLLLIASVNVVTLLLARSDGRIREMAVRSGLGASSSRLARQFATESVLLVGISTVLGLQVAHWAMQSLTGLLSTEMVSRMPYLQGAGLNGTLVAWTLGLSVIAICAFTLAPITRVAAARRLDALNESGRGSSGRSWRRLGRGLVVGELAIASMLLASAGLLAKSAYRLLNVETGFNAAQLVVTGVTPLPGPVRESPGELARQIADRVREVPGIESVGYADLLPVAQGLAPTSSFRVPGRVTDGVVPDHPVRRVSAGYFDAIEATVLSGRVFTDDDVRSAREVVVINQTAARDYFPGEDATGKRLVIGAPPARQVVGVIADIKDGPLETPPLPAAYLPFDQTGFGLVIRSSQSAAAIMPAVSRAVREVRPNVVIQPATTMTERMNRLPSASLKRASASLISGFAVTALILSVVGLYGVVAYSVGQRSHEIGLRMALGAQRWTVYRLIVSESAWLITVGTTVGIVLAALNATWMSRLLFATAPWDVATLAAGGAALAVPALVASFVPARRAATVSVLAALRTQ